jgi:Mannosyltransferase putative
VLLDKTRNFAGALMTSYLNTKKVRDDITYKRFYGDKESYWFGHAMSSTPYHFVPGYGGGIGQISHRTSINLSEITVVELVCTLQILHTLESTEEPFWFNNGIIEWKGANDDHYLVTDAWVPHEGRWDSAKDTEAKFPHMWCVQMPEAGGNKPPEPIRKIEGALKGRFDKIIKEAKKYDGLMEKENLITISRDP